MQYKIVKENPDYMLVWKPSNLATTPIKSNPECLITYLVGDYPFLKNVEGYGKPGEYGLLNRLDNKTSGLIIVAKTDEAFVNIREKFDSMQKVYLAVCYNLGTEQEGIIDIPIAHHKTDPKRMVWVTETGENQKFQYRGKIQHCETEFSVISQEEAKKIWTGYLPKEIPFPGSLVGSKEKDNFIWIKCAITKGKRHQIRIHLKYMKYPVFGDDIYSTKDKKHSKIDYYALFGVGFEGLPD